MLQEEIFITAPAAGEAAHQHRAGTWQLCKLNDDLLESPPKKSPCSGPIRRLSWVCTPPCPHAHVAAGLAHFGVPLDLLRLWLPASDC